MLKKILKHTLRALLVLLLVVLLLPVLFYLRPVQDLVRREAVAYASRALGMELSIGHLRLAFPLRLTVDGTLLRDGADTVLSCGRLSLDASLWPLLRREVAVDRFELRSLEVCYADTVSGLDLRLGAGRFALGHCRVGLRTRRVSLGSAALSDADIVLGLQASDVAGEQDTTSSQPWTVELGQLVVANTSFGMRTAPVRSELTVRLPGGMVEQCVVRLGDRDVAVRSLLLERGEYAYLTDPVSRAGSPATTTGPERAAELPQTPPSQPWTVRVGCVTLSDNRIEYGTLGHVPAAGFDPAFIALKGLDLAVDSLYNRGADVAMRIRSMRFAERCGVAVRELGGGFRMDSSGMALSAFMLVTDHSDLRADLTAGAGLLHLDGASPLEAALTARVGMEDVACACPALAVPALDGRNLGVDFAAAGTLGDLEQLSLGLSLSGLAGIEAEGKVRNLPDIGRLGADVRFDGGLHDGAVLLELLPDTALRRRVTLPARLQLYGEFCTEQGRSRLASVLDAGTGRLGMEGRYDSRGKRYALRLQCDSFPAGSFLRADSAGMADLRVTAAGEGFDPTSEATRAALRAQIGRLEYRGHDFGGLELEADLMNRQLTGRLFDSDEALRLSLDLAGTLTPRQQQLSVTGRVSDFDLQALGLMHERLGGGFTLEAGASASVEGSYAARLRLDSIAIRSDGRIDSIRTTQLSFASDTAATRAGLQSGDLALTFRAEGPLDSLSAGMARVADMLRQQLRDRRIDAARLGAMAPHFGLRLTAGRNNILNSWLMSRNASLRSLHIEAANGDTLPLALRMRAAGLSSGGLRFDTVEVACAEQGRRIDYALRVANAPGNMDHLARAVLSGYLVDDTCRIDLRQQNRSGCDVFHFGWNVVWTDSLLRASIFPTDPLLGYARWTVNPDNCICYGPGGRIAADVDLTHGAQRFALRTVPQRDSTETLRLDIAGVGIGPMLQLLPEVPAIDGMLGAGVVLARGADSLSLEGGVTVKGLSYEEQPFGDVGLDFSCAGGHTYCGALRFTLDSAEVLTGRGSYEPDNLRPLDFALSIPGFPLERANVFLPSDLIRLTGSFGGSLRGSGTAAAPQLEGGVHFSGATLRVPMIGTTFALCPDTVLIRNSRVLFDDYAVTAPNGRRLTLDGQVDLSDFAAMTADVALHASDFQAVHVARREGSAVYGDAYLDLNAAARGPLDALVVRGRVGLLGGTDIRYVMQDSPMDIRQRPQQVVSFVSFRDLDSLTLPPTVSPVRIGGMDVLLNVDINSDVKAGVDLSADGQNRIDLEGGGNLTYAMNPLGDVRFTGKYELSGGTVSYNPPVISRKVFRIEPNGYVEWLGELADPSFNITAVETVRANVSTDGQETRAVNFDISINIRNSLDNLEISFDLTAPEDLSMQNELNSLTAEQRANQAMGLLVYNTYTGPGTTARVAAGNPLNAFIQKELNQWAQNSLKGVDLSFGIDSYGESDPGGQHTDYSYRLSKNLFGNRVRAVIGGSFSTDADPTQNLRENIIGDISLEYMLNKRDNMFIKLFRHTGYESILEGEITETGVGFVIRKRLLRFADLFRLTKRRLEKQQSDESAIPAK